MPWHHQIAAPQRTGAEPVNFRHRCPWLIHAVDDIEIVLFTWLNRASPSLGMIGMTPEKSVTTNQGSDASRFKIFRIEVTLTFGNGN